jgi:hypothetical protein
VLCRFESTQEEEFELNVDRTDIRRDIAMIGDLYRFNGGFLWRYSKLENAEHVSLTEQGEEESEKDDYSMSFPFNKKRSRWNDDYNDSGENYDEVVKRESGDYDDYCI